MCGNGQSTLKEINSAADFQQMSLENPGKQRRKTVYFNYLDNQNKNEEMTTPGVYYQDSFRFFNLESTSGPEKNLVQGYYDPYINYFQIRFLENSVQMKQEDYGMVGKYFNDLFLKTFCVLITQFHSPST